MQRSLDSVVDVLRVPASGDASLAVLPVEPPAAWPEAARAESCEILIAGGGTGGVAAALAAARSGRRVVLLEETDWLGGQMTAQGVSALDEHEHIESFGGTRSYYELRARLREHYGVGNPGACWVTRLAFEPRVAVGVIQEMLRPHVDSGRLRIYLRKKAVAATTHGDRITEVVAMGLDDGRLLRFQPELVIDATELGDLLPLCGAEHVIGAETVAQTGEPQAQPVEAKPHCVQSFTYTFACERRAKGESHVVSRPEKYEHYKAAQPYSLRIEVHGGEIYGETSGWLQYSLYEQLPGTKGGLWTYRRLVEKQNLTMFNWPGNDYRDRSLLDCSPHDAAKALQDAKRVSLGFLYWLQTEQDAPELLLRPDVMGSADGLSKHPYIREVAAHQGEEDHRRAGSIGAPPERPARRAFRGFRRGRLVPDRHPPLRPRRRRRELPHQAVPDSARRIAAGACRQFDRGREEHRHHAYHQWLLPAASGRMERRRGRGSAGGVRAREPHAARCGAGGCRRAGAVPAPAAGGRRAARLAEFMM